MDKFDLIVIGAGAAGLTAAFTGLGFGKRVLIVEKDQPGGECTWSGCVPSKGLINRAKDIHTASKFAHVNIDTASILEEVRGVSEAIYKHETPEVLEEAGAVFVQGEASFVSPRTIQVGSTRYQGKRIVIATGSNPLVPPIPGLKDVPFLTNETFFTQTELPKSMIVLGAGAIGMELAQAMNRLGTRVKVVEMMPEVMFREEPEFAELIRNVLTDEGVEFYMGVQAVGVEKNEQGICLRTEQDGVQSQVEADALLLALGRNANIGQLNVGVAGIEVDRVITVDAHLQTTAKGVYACGDVAGPYQLSHMANFQAKIATMNALLPMINRKVKYDHVAWTTFTDPEFARAGMTEEEARGHFGDAIRVFHYDFAEKLDRAKTKKGDLGRIKLITRKGKLLGAHIIGERAGELISEVQVLKTLGLKFSKLQSVIHPYPTYSDSLRQMAQQVFIDNLVNHPMVRLLKR